MEKSQAREDFERLVREFSEAAGVEAEVDETGGCSIGGRNTIVNMQILEDSEYLLIWAIVGYMPEDANATKRFHWMLQQNDGWITTEGFTYMMSPENRGVFAADRRPLRELESADHLAAWIERLTHCVDMARAVFDTEMPFVDDDPLPGDEEEEEVQ